MLELENIFGGILSAQMNVTAEWERHVNGRGCFGGICKRQRELHLRAEDSNRKL